MKRIGAVCVVVGLLAVAGAVNANTVASSTMYFSGPLSIFPGGYAGILNATAGTYYVPGGPGTHVDASQPSGWATPDGRNAVGGFDVYADSAGNAYVQGVGAYAVGADHDAYDWGAGPWGGWWDPDVPDWNLYQLEVTADHWYLRYASTWESPMSGTMDWGALIAKETDLGTQDRPQVRSDGNAPSPLHGGHGGSAAQGGGGGAWDCDWGWGVEVIPLQYSDFKIGMSFNAQTEEWEVTLTPVPEPLTMLGLALGLGSVGAYIRRCRKA